MNSGVLFPIEVICFVSKSETHLFDNVHSNFYNQIELLCDKLSAMELTSLSDILGGPEAAEEGSNVAVSIEALAEVKQCAVETAAGAERQSLQAIQQRNQARKEAAAKAKEAKLARASSPWSKEESGALAKAVKKYPPGGSNRSLYVNINVAVL